MSENPSKLHHILRHLGKNQGFGNENLWPIDLTGLIEAITFGFGVAYGSSHIWRESIFLFEAINPQLEIRLRSPLCPSLLASLARYDKYYLLEHRLSENVHSPH